MKVLKEYIRYYISGSLRQVRENDISCQIKKLKNSQGTSENILRNYVRSIILQHINEVCGDVNDDVADEYYNSRSYNSRIGAWASKQSRVLKNRKDLILSIEEYKKKYNKRDDVPRPKHWSGWNLLPSSIEFWLDGDNRIHERLKYSKDEKGNWNKILLNP